MNFTSPTSQQPHPHPKPCPPAHTDGKAPTPHFPLLWWSPLGHHSIGTIRRTPERIQLHVLTVLMKNESMMSSFSPRSPKGPKAGGAAIGDEELHNSVRSEHEPAGLSIRILLPGGSPSRPDPGLTGWVPLPASPTSSTPTSPSGP